jgi:ATP-dependent DNA helicase RecG
MSSERVQRLLKEPENIRLEFKEAINSLPGNLFESICAMLNRDGGDIILGANDAGVVLGVVEYEISTMVTNLVNLSNNQQKLTRLLFFFLKRYKYQANG